MPFSGLPERVAAIREVVSAAVQRGGHGQHVEIVAVTKTYGPDAVVAAWNAGLASVGENRIQEALDKMGQVTVPVQWHLIGHLQRNKARHVERFHLVHSVDSLRLAQAVDEVGRARGVPVQALIQVNTTGEESKGGFSLAELATHAEALSRLGGLHVKGVMTMAPLGATETVLREAFGRARDARDLLRQGGLDASELSMGMSGDYEVAVEEGATMIRLGTILFGARH
ncbi:MAG: YggS family pyridoxal phosphate-dependent enzyme [Gemmatimonadetes bacterium]|nr:YggS family pyridoxal phosphate-dependent enzyme [Gemmatimonadota bacterium]